MEEEPEAAAVAVAQREAAAVAQREAARAARAPVAQEVEVRPLGVVRLRLRPAGPVRLRAAAARAAAVDAPRLLPLQSNK